MTIKIFGYEVFQVTGEEKQSKLDKQGDIVYNNCLFEAEKKEPQPGQEEGKPTLRQVNIKEVISYTAKKTGLNPELCERIIDVANNFVLYGEQKDDEIE